VDRSGLAEKMTYEPELERSEAGSTEDIREKGFPAEAASLCKLYRGFQARAYLAGLRNSKKPQGGSLLEIVFLFIYSFMYLFLVGLGF
jgi:hypothetical protein